jgi:DNA-binding transcriptional LysR family regulator
MDLSLLKTFLTLAKTKNFTRAASQLGRTQSAISLQIARLETLLCHPLFDRQSRHLTLTAYGELLLEPAKKMLCDEAKLLELFRKKNLSGEVRFGTPEDLATVFLTPILSSFIAHYPDVSLSVNCQLTRDLIEAFHKKKHDIILIKQEELHTHLASEILSSEPLVWVGPGEFHRPSILKLVLAPAPCIYRQRALDVLTEHHIPSKIIYNSPSLAGILAAVKAGLGVTILPKRLVPDYLQPIEGLPKLKPILLSLVIQENAPAVVKEFASFVKNHLNDVILSQA